MVKTDLVGRDGPRPTLKRKQKDKNNSMKRNLPLFAALAISLMSSALVPSLKASEWNERTVITISQPVSVEGTILPAGQYVLTLQDHPSSSKDVVLVFNGDETKLITTVLAIHAYRLTPTDKSEFSFYDSPGQPAALHTWFYPGNNSGLEFLQPQRAPQSATRQVAD
jgi:hypothetical protein